MTRPRTSLIIGGGIAGPAAALALQKAGIDPAVYEAHPTGADGIGAFLTLASNAVDALRVLSSDRPALAAGFPTPAIIIRWAARINNSKAAGAVATVFRDAMLPMILRMTAGSKALRQTYDHHIDWDAPTAAGA